MKSYRDDLETRIGQLFINVLQGVPRSVGAWERAFLRRYRPGGLIVYRRHVESRAQIRAYLAELQALNDALELPGPLIVCVDHRGGEASILHPAAGGLEFPAPLAQAALGAGAGEAGRAIGAAVARDVLDVGFNLNLAPYGDVRQRSEIDRFTFGNALMGQDPQVNAALAVGLIQGMRAHGLASTYCVFPGGYGTVPGDPHHFPGVIDGSREELEKSILVVPRAALAHDPEAVMLSHVQFPALDPEGHPATFSPPIISELLRDELGFKGLVMTDAIRMQAAVAVAGSPGEAAVRALQAGADLVLCAGWEERLAVAAAVREGRLPRERIDEAFGRVLALKERLQRESGTAPRREADPADAAAMAGLIERSLTWVKRPAELLTTEAGRDPAVAFAAGTRWPEFLQAAAAVVGGDLEAARLSPPTWYWGDADRGYKTEDLQHLLAVTEPGQRLLFGTASADDVRLAAALKAQGRNVWVAHGGSACDVRHGLDCDGVLLAYSRGPQASRKAVEAFYGLAAPGGTLPVDL